MTRKVLDYCSVAFICLVFPLELLWTGFLFAPHGGGLSTNSPVLEQLRAIALPLPVLIPIWALLTAAARGVRRRRRFFIGVAVLALPLLIPFWLKARTYYRDLKSKSFVEEARIENFSEAPIYWPGLAGPIGVQIELDLVYSGRPYAFLRKPRIVYEGFASDKLVYLHQAHDFRSLSSDPNLSTGNGRLHLVFRLYSSLLHYVRPDRKEICFERKYFNASCRTSDCRPHRQDFLVPQFPDDQLLSAEWRADYFPELYVLDGHLTNALRKSELLNNAELRAAIHSEVEPADWEKMGYVPCEGSQDSLSVKRLLCYCAHSPASGQ